MITLGSTIREILDVEELTTLLGSNESIYPVTILGEVNFPFVVYSTNGYDVQASKDRGNDVDTVEIAVLAIDYDQGATIAQKVFDLMLKQQSLPSNIIQIDMDNHYETYKADAFMQVLVFKIENN